MHGSDSIVITATFAGFLADEKGLKEVFSIKGQAGSVPCFSCLNIRNRWVKIAGRWQHMWDPDLSQRQYATKDHIIAITNRLSRARASDRGKLETQLGINYSAQMLPTISTLKYSE